MKSLYKNRPRLSMLVILILILGGCERRDHGLPSREQVPKGAPLPIDGTWELKIDPVPWSLGKVKIEGGRIFTLDIVGQKTGSVLVKDLKKLDDTRYGATLLSGIEKGENEKMENREIIIEVISPNELLQEVPGEEPGVSHSIRYSLISLEDPKLFMAAHGNKEQRQGGRLKGVELVSLSDESLEAYSEYREIDAGAITETKRSRTIEHVVSLDSAVTKAGSITGKLFENIGLEVRAQIEEKLGHSFIQSETVENSVRLDGNKAKKWRLTWSDKIKSGIARYTDEEGITYSIPFRFIESTELKAKSVK